MGSNLLNVFAKLGLISSSEGNGESFNMYHNAGTAFSWLQGAMLGVSPVVIQSMLAPYVTTRVLLVL